MLAKFDGSATGAEAFCRREAISEASVYLWRRPLGNGPDGAGVVGSDITPAFVDLDMLKGDYAPRLRFDLRLDLATAWFCICYAADVIPRTAGAGVCLWSPCRHA